ncbi:MAG: C-GCAxxG-C-C family protein [Bacillota bacterium]
MVKKTGSLFYAKGYNCAESCWLALTDVLPSDERNHGVQLAGGFGGGCARGELCGAISGAVMVLGQYYGRMMGQPKHEKLRLLVEQLMDGVRGRYGSANCVEIKKHETVRAGNCTPVIDFVVELTEFLLDQSLAEEQGECG